MKSMLTGAAIALVMTTVVAQSALTGKWTGATANGIQILLELAATDTTVTGTLTRGDEPVSITDGKVSKNTFTFKATFGDQAESITGELAGDQLTVWLDRQGRGSAVVFTRVRN